MDPTKEVKIPKSIAAPVNPRAPIGSLKHSPTISSGGQNALDRIMANIIKTKEYNDKGWNYIKKSPYKPAHYIPPHSPAFKAQVLEPRAYKHLDAKGINKIIAKKPPTIQTNPIGKSLRGGFSWDRANPNLKPRPLNKPPLTLDNRFVLGKNRSIIGEKPTGLFDWDYKGKVSDPSKLPAHTTPLRASPPGINTRSVKGTMNTTGAHTPYTPNPYWSSGIPKVVSPLRYTANSLMKNVVAPLTTMDMLGHGGKYLNNLTGTDKTFNKVESEGRVTSNLPMRAGGEFLRKYGQNPSNNKYLRIGANFLGNFSNMPEFVEKNTVLAGVDARRNVDEIIDNPIKYGIDSYNNAKRGIRGLGTDIKNTYNTSKDTVNYMGSEIGKTYSDIKSKFSTPTTQTVAPKVDPLPLQLQINKERRAGNISKGGFNKLLGQPTKIPKSIKPQISTTIPKVKSFSDYYKPQQSFQ